MSERIAYGEGGEQFGELHRPSAVAAAVPVVVLVHGGFWRHRYDLTLMDGLARSITAGGHAAWNIEYRRVGGGGGWPATLDDVAAAVDHVARLEGVDAARVAVVGHSAGGHLAAWAASRHRIAAGRPGAGPAVRPALAVALAGVLDLSAAAGAGVGGSAVSDLLGGGPERVPERYAAASPAALLPAGVPVLAVHGDDDDIVPVDQSRRYVDAARAAGDAAELVVVPGADHFDVIDPAHASWGMVLDRLARGLT